MKNEQQAIEHFLVSQKSVGSTVPSTGKTICHSEVCMSESKCFKVVKQVLLTQTGDTHQHTQMNKT
jgi:hypothetical protein